MDPNSVEGTTRRYLMMGIMSMTVWRGFLVLRQIMLVAVTTIVPPMLAKAMKQQDFAGYRRVAIVSLIGNAFELARGAAMTLSRIYRGYPAWLWNLTGSYANSMEGRTLMYPILEIMLANWFPMTFILLVFLVTWNLVALLTLYFYVAFLIVLSTFLTFMLITLTKHLGPAAIMYVAIPLNILEMLNIIAVIEFVLPFYCQQLPPDAKATLNPVAGRVNYPASKICMIPEEATDFSPNAAYMGLMGFKIIVITESLLKSVGLVDTRSVLAHELGHWARGHMAVGVTTRLFQTIMCCFMLAISYGNSLLFQVFGFHDSDPPHPAVGVLVCWQYIVPLANAVILGVSYHPLLLLRVPGRQIRGGHGSGRRTHQRPNDARQRP
ncbi:hypothetical protein GE061_005169 [Apolygus lucorum]|uniref:Peptidase M48 domain-containing protein n=1 Tax=Apolygus lucorum TaxID=248454 RepID=A0A8S9WZF0_APOLU|nr:hypothetical protein GE061_005169 [Apolygus lucorum]